MPHKMLPFLALPLLTGYALAQSTIPVTGSGLVDTFGNPITGTLTIIPTDTSDTPISYTPLGGTATTAPIVDQIANGAMLFGSTMVNPATVTPSTAVYRLVLADARGNTIYTLPLTTINAPQFSIQRYALQPGPLATGNGYPKINCSPGATYSDLKNGGNQWICSKLTTDNTTAWTQNPSSSAQCGGLQALVSPFVGQPYCTSSENAYLPSGFVIGGPATGNGPVGVVTAPSGTGGGTVDTIARTAASAAQTSATNAASTASTAATNAQNALNAAQAASQAAANAMPLTGGTFTGAVKLSDGGTAASQTYVANQVTPVNTTATNAASAAASAQTTANAALPKSGGTLTGTLTNTDGSPVASQVYVTSRVPTKVSQITNDSNFITAAQAPVQTVNGTAPTNGNITVTANVNAPASSAYLGTNSAGQLVAAAAPTAAAAGTITGVVQTNDGTGKLAADSTVQLQTDHSLITPWPRVNIRSSLFQAGWTYNGKTQASCTYAADPTSNNDSTCAIASAIAYLVARRGNSPNSNTGTLYFPTGTYKVNSTTNVAAILISGANITVEGDGYSSSYILNTSTTATAIEYMAALGSELKNIHILGIGHNQTANGVEIIDSPQFKMSHVQIESIGGISLNLQGSTERSVFSESDILSSNVAINTGGDDNEVYFTHVNVLYSGNDAGNYCYSRVNCTNGVIHTGTTANPAVWYVDPTPAIKLQGENIKYEHSSIKGLVLMSGIKYSGALGRLENLYLEGYNNNNAAINRAIQLIGSAEIGRTTAAITSSQITIPVDDAIYQPLNIADVAYAQTASFHAGTQLYKVGCSDFVWGSTAQSTVCPGVLKGQYEVVQVHAFSSDGNAYVIRENAGSVTAGSGNAGELNAPFAWPAGSLIAAIPAANYGPTTITSNHINTDDGAQRPNTYNPICSDTTKLPLNTPGGNTELCADVLVGGEPDGFVIPLPSQGLETVTAAAQMQGNAMYFDGNAANWPYGSGYVKIAGQGNVSYGGNDGIPLNGPYPATTAAAGLFEGGEVSVDFVNWPAGGLASGLATSEGSNLKFFSSHNAIDFQIDYFEALAGGVQARHTQILNPNYNCIENQTLAGVNGTRTCRSATQIYDDAWNGTAWVRISTNTVNGFELPNSDYLAGGVIPAGTGFAHLIPNSGGSTYTLPALGPGSKIDLYFFNGNPATLTGPAGINYYYDDRSIGIAGSMTVPGTLATIQCVGDSNSAIVCNGPNTPFAASLASTGTGFGTISTAAAVTGSAQDFRLTVTTSATGTAGGTAATVNFTPSLAHSPSACSVIAESGPATAAGFYVPPLTPGAALASVNVIAANAAAAGQYALDVRCPRD